MTALSLVLTFLGGFIAFGDFEPIQNALGVLLLCICLRWFIRLTQKGVKND